MDIVLSIAGFLCILVGLVGAVLPLPGPPLSFGGLLLIHFTKYAQFSENFLIALGFITALLAVLDYYVPIWGTKKLGGTQAGIRGSAIGMFLGLFAGPFGIFIGAFLGALVGELINKTPFNQALKASLGSFLGFAAGIIAKLALCIFILYKAVLIFV